MIHVGTAALGCPAKLIKARLSRAEQAVGWSVITRMYDLIIIGAGPAGSSAAISAARCGARVLLLERGRFPRHKVCGEFVSAESLGLLTNLLDGHYATLLQNAVRISKARLFLDGRTLQTAVHPPAASIARL